jgi:hypothetical protein
LKILDKVDKIVNSSVQLTGKEMVKLQLRIVLNEEKEDVWHAQIIKRKNYLRVQEQLSYAIEGQVNAINHELTFRE